MGEPPSPRASTRTKFQKTLHSYARLQSEIPPPARDIRVDVDPRGGPPGAAETGGKMNDDTRRRSTARTITPPLVRPAVRARAAIAPTGAGIVTGIYRSQRAALIANGLMLFLNDPIRPSLRGGYRTPFDASIPLRSAAESQANGPR